MGVSAFIPHTVYQEAINQEKFNLQYKPVVVFTVPVLPVFFIDVLLEDSVSKPSSVSS